MKNHLGGIAMCKIGIIIGSTRPNRVGKGVADWVYSIAKTRSDAEFELIDLVDYNLPLLDEPIPPSQDKYSKEHTKRWSEKIDSLDGFIFVTPEYNHSTSGALKNALDFLYKEWNNKAAGFVSYGSIGGFRAVECLRLIMGELQVADVRLQVGFSLRDDFENWSVLKPNPHHESALNKMLDQLIPWTEAMMTVRQQSLPMNQSKSVSKNPTPAQLQ
jgi:NAD(P)H-dependent FMN reductase